MKALAIALTIVATGVATIIVLFLPSALTPESMTISAPTELSALAFDNVQQASPLEERVATLESEVADLVLTNKDLVQRVSALELLTTVPTETSATVISDTLTPEPLAKTDLDILLIDAKVTETNDVFWRYAWKLTIKNPSNSMVAVDALIKFLDNDGFVVKDERAYNLVIPAGTTQTFTDFSLIGSAVAGDVVSVSVETYVKSIVPAEVTPMPDDTPAATNVDATPQVGSMDKVYVVQVGDDIESVAEQFGVNVEELVAKNELPNSEYLFVGQRLLIPNSTNGE